MLRFTLWFARKAGRNDGKRGLPLKDSSEHSGYPGQVLGFAETRGSAIAGHYKRITESCQKDFDKKVTDLTRLNDRHNVLKTQYPMAAHDNPLSKMWYWIAVILLYLGDFPLVWAALGDTGISDRYKYSVAFVFALSLLISAKIVGIIFKEMELAKSNKRKEN